VKACERPQTPLRTVAKGPPNMKYRWECRKPVRFEFENKSAQLNMRLPKQLLDAVKRRAKERGIPYTRFLRELIEQGISMPLR
jgi:predicted DNA binding CopG/RHH family protein